MVGLCSLDRVGSVGVKLQPRRTAPARGWGIIPMPVHISRDANYPTIDRWLTSTRNAAAVTGACQIVRMAAWHELDGLDEALAVGYNDVDFALRLCAGGWRVVYTPEVVVGHRESASRGNLHPYDDVLGLIARWDLLGTTSTPTPPRGLVTGEWPRVLGAPATSGLGPGTLEAAKGALAGESGPRGLDDPAPRRRRPGDPRRGRWRGDRGGARRAAEARAVLWKNYAEIATWEGLENWLPWGSVADLLEQTSHQVEPILDLIRRHDAEIVSAEAWLSALNQQVETVTRLLVDLNREKCALEAMAHRSSVEPSDGLASMVKPAGWAQLSRVRAVQRVLDEAPGPLHLAEIEAVLRSHGRFNDDVALISATLAYLKRRRGTVASVGGGRWEARRTQPSTSGVVGKAPQPVPSISDI